MSWFKKFGKSDWWVGENSLFGQATQTVADTGIINQWALGSTGVGATGGSAVASPINPAIIYGGIGLVLLKALKII